MADGRIVIDTKLDKSGLEQGLKSLQTVLKTGLAALGVSSLSKVIGSIANETKALNDSVRKASTLFGDVAVNTDALKKKMSDLAIATGSSSEEIGEALYNALSAGVEVTEDMGAALGFVEKSIKTSKAGFADLATTVTATASVLNAYGMATKEADRVQGILLQTQNLGITTVAELSSTLAQVVPTASAFGVSFEQVGASLATMTAQGTKTAQATTSLNSLLAELGKNGQQGADNLKKAGEHAGIGAKGFKELVDEGYTLSDILQMMDKYARDNNISLVDMFGSIEAGKAALQLAANEGEKFNDSLAKMSETAGLVDKGFNIVLSNADRLKNAFNELKKQIGNEIAPALDKTTGKMADFIEKIVTNKREAERLDFAFEELSLAVEDFKQKQEDAKVATDALSLSLAEQSRQNMASSVFDNAKLFGEAVASIKELEAENEDLRKDTADMWATIRAEADKYGLTLAGIAKYSTQGMYEEEGFYSDAVVAYREGTKHITEWGEQIDANTALIEKNRSETANYIAQMARMVSSGALDMELLASAGYGLSDAVQKYVSYMDQASAEAEGYSGSISQLEQALDLYEKKMAAQDIGSGAWIKWAAYVDVYKEALDEAVKAQEALNKSTGTGGASSPSVEPKAGVRGASTDPLLDIYSKMNDELDVAKKMSIALGDSYDLASEQASIYESALKEMIENGLDPASATAKKLKKSIDDLKGDSGESEGGIFSGLFDDFSTAEKAGDKLGGVLASSMEAFINEIATAGQRLEELSEQLTDVNEDITEAEEEKQELQAELAEAQARGDKDAIENAEKKIKQLEKQIEGHKTLRDQLEAEKKSVESGAEAWKAFGKSALFALAEILSGLGHELTARAVTAAISQKYGDAILATGGAIAAYTASGLIKTAANSFATGGIVQRQGGTAMTGDNHVAFVNPGELILNQAQQSNLADQIRAMSDGLRSGGNIIISLSGAHIYGLDEPAVGRAIYDNIERLRSEGVL